MHEAKTIPVAVEVDVETYLQQRQTQLQEQLETVQQLAAEDKLPEVRLEKGKFHFTRLKTDQPEGMTELTRRAYALLPPIKITDLLLEVEASTGFSRHFTHLQSGDRVEDKITLLTATLADALNLGLSKMAAASPEISYRRLAWMSDWYIREETYSRALTELVNFHHRLAFSSHWGDGTTSSSDGQHFPVGGIRSALARTNVYYGTEPGVMFYTHLSDQYDPFYVKVISTTVRQASYALDGLLYHETDLAIQEHYTDTLGYTDHVFALCHLLGFRFAPRIRQFNHQRLYIFEKATTYPQLQAHIGGRIEIDLVRQEWDNILRLASSVRSGTVTASLILQRLASYPRQPRLGRALREVGRLERTFFALDWLQSSTLRQRVFLGLQKGEARNSLARAVFLHRLGKVQDRSFENQSYRASGLNLVIAAIALWNTVYLERAIEQLKADGTEITEEQLRHLSPLSWGHINLTGDYVWNRQQTTSLENLRALTSPTQSS
jgi:TnpA family transposase